MDRRTREIVDRFDARTEEIAADIAAQVRAEVEGFGPVRDTTLEDEVHELARGHVQAFVHSVRSGGPAPPGLLEAVRARAASRAREMVPLPALLHAYLIGQRVISNAIVREAGTSAGSRGAALELTAMSVEYNLTTTSAMTEAYVTAAHGELADLEASRRELIDALMSNGVDSRPELLRRAASLGFDPERAYVLALATTHEADPTHPRSGSLRGVVDAIVRAADEPPPQTFVVHRGEELLALLHADGGHAAKLVLERAAKTVQRTQAVLLMAGVGTPFKGLSGLRTSYEEARRALRHSTPRRPLVFGPDDVRLFDELTASRDEAVIDLIPERTRAALGDDALRATLEALVEANLNVADAAAALSLHPNSVRYRLRRIAELTGRDPRQLNDLLELIAAARLLAASAPVTA